MLLPDTDNSKKHVNENVNHAWQPNVNVEMMMPERRNKTYNSVLNVNVKINKKKSKKSNNVRESWSSKDMIVKNADELKHNSREFEPTKTK